MTSQLTFDAITARAPVQSTPRIVTVWEVINPDVVPKRYREYATPEAARAAKGWNEVVSAKEVERDNGQPDRDD